MLVLLLHNVLENWFLFMLSLVHTLKLKLFFHQLKKAAK